MVRLQLSVFGLLLAPSLVLAQPARPPTERVTVTAPKEVPPEVINHFIQSFAAPTQLLGKLSRWETGICPVAVGLRPAAIQFVIQRLKDNAKKVGAPVNDRPHCKPNIEIVFTSTPQGLLDNVRKDHQIYLGYSSSSSQADKLAMVTRPIQAWYTTASIDINGIPKIDSPRTVGIGDQDHFIVELYGGHGNVSGFRMRDGRTSTLFNVIIAVNPTKLANHEIGGVADYISLLALSQVASLDRCPALASIANMLVPGCAASASEMTQNDFAFLRGLYKMSIDGNLRMQEDGISYEMREAFKER
jgi:hypothetical protein